MWLVKHNESFCYFGTGAEEKPSLAYWQDNRITLHTFETPLSDANTAKLYLHQHDWYCKGQPIHYLFDCHPDYIVRHLLGSRINHDAIYSTVQHHHAHVSAVMYEHGLKQPVCAFAFDGNGLGDDNTLWGGECLIYDGLSFSRFAHLEALPLIGGEAAIREPHRIAFALRAAVDAHDTQHIFTNIMNIPKLSPHSTSMGRLFDGLSSLLGLCHVNTKQAEAACLLQALAEKDDVCSGAYERLVTFSSERPYRIQYVPLIQKILADLQNGRSKASIAYDFHHWIVMGMLAVARLQPIRDIILCGGVFQNHLLRSLAKNLFSKAGYSIYTAERLPNHDGAIAVGQLYYQTLCA